MAARIHICLLFTLQSFGCALIDRSTPVEAHYFSPDSRITTLSAADARAVTKGGAPIVRVGQISAGPLFRSRKIVFRSSASELSTYEDSRWSDHPDAYVRRALSRALFTNGSLEAGLTEQSPTLDIEILSFEELRQHGARAGRVELLYTLHDEHHVIASGDVAVEEPAREASIDGVVSAIGVALDEAARQLAAATIVGLTPPPP